MCLFGRPFVRSFFRMYVFECVCLREYERTCVHAGVHACMHVCMIVWLAVFLSVPFVFACVLAYVRAGVHACMHVYLSVWLVS